MSDGIRVFRPELAKDLGLPSFDGLCPRCEQRPPCHHCRLYRGPAGHGGYGRIWVGPAGERKRSYLHRWVVEQAYGITIPSGFLVMHLCDRPACFYIGHLTVGTNSDNMRDAYSKSRMTPPSLFKAYSDDVPCPRGHLGAFVRTKQGCRECRTCRRDARQAKRRTAS